MKILHINTNDFGGAAIASIRLHRLLLSYGIDSKILFLRKSSKIELNESYYYEDSFRFKFWFYIVLYLNTIFNRRFTFYKPNVYFNGPDSLFNLANHELFKRADIIHLHWVVKFLDWEKCFINNSKYFVWTLHDMNPFTGGEHYNTNYNNDFHLISKLNIKKKIRAIQNIRMYIICPSHWIAKLAIESIVFRNLIIKIVRNPLDICTFIPKYNPNLKIKYKLPSNKIILLFVAENPTDKRKGFNLFQNLFINLDPDRFHLALLGKIINFQFITGSYTFLGTIINEQDLSEIYNASDIFVIPSIEDNSPNTISESLLCGTPVVAYNIGGISEFVINGTNGYLSNTFEELEDALFKTINHKFDKNNVRNSIINKLNPNSICIEIIEVYNTLLSEKK